MFIYFSSTLFSIFLLFLVHSNSILLQKVNNCVKGENHQLESECRRLKRVREGDKTCTECKTYIEMYILKLNVQATCNANTSTHTTLISLFLF